MAEKVLITGGAGFIGSHLADLLITQGYDIVVLDNLHPQIHGIERKRPAYLHPSIQLIEGDVRDATAVKHALKDVSIIYHFAAHTGVGQSMYQIEEYMDVNVRGTAVLLDTITSFQAQIKKLILASSRAVYGEGSYYCKKCKTKFTPLPRAITQLHSHQWEPTCPSCRNPITARPTQEIDQTDPGSVYAISKLTQEQLCLLIGKTYHIPTVILRFFNVYGPRQSLQNPYTGVINTFFTRLQAKKPPKVYEDGFPSRDFVHVKDIVNACFLALQNQEANYQIFNIGSGEKITLIEMAQIIADLYGGPDPTVTGEFRAGDIRHCFADITKANNILGYLPAIQFSQGINNLIHQVKQKNWEDYSEIAEKELKQRGLSNR